MGLFSVFYTVNSINFSYRLPHIPGMKLPKGWFCWKGAWPGCWSICGVPEMDSVWEAAPYPASGGVIC